MPFSFCLQFVLLFLLQLTNSIKKAFNLHFIYKQNKKKKVSSSLNVCDVHASFLFVFAFSLLLCPHRGCEDNQGMKGGEVKNFFLSTERRKKRVKKFFHYAPCHRPLWALSVVFFIQRKKKKKKKRKCQKAICIMISFASSLRLSENLLFIVMQLRSANANNRTLPKRHERDAHLALFWTTLVFHKHF